MDVTIKGRAASDRPETETRTEAETRTETGAEAGHWLELSRHFAAPRALVFAAFAQTRHLRRWCCPAGFTVTRAEGDFREGGAWTSAMTGPDGTLHRMAGAYLEIEPGRLIRQSHAWIEADGSRGPERRIEIRLADEAAGTRLRFRMGPFETEANRDGHGAGWSQCLDHLEGLLPGLLAEDADPPEDPRSGG